MKNKGSSGIIGIVAILAAILFFTAKGLFPILTGILKAVLGIVAVGVVVIVAAVVYFAFRKSDGKTEETEKQYASLFDNDMLDMSVEMEALTIACKRDGLLTDEDFKM